MLNVSKWIKIPLLLDEKEMEALFAALPPFNLYAVQKVMPKGEGIVPHATFLEAYAAYIAALKRGEMPERSDLFACALSVIEEAVVRMLVGEERELYKPTLPVVQMQPHAVRYSAADRSFRSQLYGADGIAWGIQLGFPQIFQDPTTHAIVQTRALPNGRFFHAIQKWVRSETRATPFLIDGERQNVPIRLGKACFAWIDSHPQLGEIRVDRREDTPPVHTE